jgi:transposase
MQEIVDHYPEECSGCGREFADSEKVPRHGPGRHQVAELPGTAVFYVEHRTHRLRCAGCQRRTRARLGTVGESAFGPALQAAVVALTARNRISRRDMSELLSELFAVRISVGAIDAICQRTSLLLASPHARLASQVLGSGAVNVDETGWYLAGENRTMWTAATGQAAIFRIVEDRHRDRLQELLGSDFEGIVTSDRWWAYDLLDPSNDKPAGHISSATSGSTARAWPPNRSSGRPASSSPAGCLKPGTPTQPIKTALGSPSR